MRRKIFENALHPSVNKKRYDNDRHLAVEQQHQDIESLLNQLIPLKASYSQAHRHLFNSECLLSQPSVQEFIKHQQLQPLPTSSRELKKAQSFVTKLLVGLEYRSFVNDMDYHAVVTQHLSAIKAFCLKRCKVNWANPAIANLICLEAKHYEKYPGGSVFRKKIHPDNSINTLPNTQIRTNSGAIYALINTLTSKQVAAVLSQYGLTVRNRKFLLGEGGFGTVRLAINLMSGEIVAVKKIGIRPGKTQHWGGYQGPWHMGMREQAVMKILGEHPLLVHLLDSAHIQDKAGNEKTYLFMAIAGKQDGVQALRNYNALRQYIKTDDRVVLKGVSKNYLSAVKVLHDKGIFHCDIKPENFIHQDEVTDLKLGDFCFATELDWDSRGGTQGYYPPEHSGSESLSHYPYSARSHDVFALGISLLAWREGKHPSKSNQDVRLNIGHKKIRLDFDGQGNCLGIKGEYAKTVREADGSTFDDLIAKCILFNPAQRMTIDQALGLRFFEA